MTKIRAYMDAVFGPISEAAGHPEWLPRLFTSDLAPDRKEEQFARLKRLKRYGDEALPLTKSGFVARFRDIDTAYLCISTVQLTSTDSETLSNDLISYGCTEDILDESVFLFLAYNFRNVYKIRSDLSMREASLNAIDMSDSPDKYTGHDIQDVMSWYETVSIFKLESDSIFTDCNNWFIAAHIASAHARYRADLLSSSQAAKIRQLQDIGNVNPENIYLALTSQHWKQVFFELYKNLESIHYLPWILDFKSVGGYSVAGLAIAEQCMESLSWRSQEKASMGRLFELGSEEIVSSKNIFDTEPFREFRNSKPSKAEMGRVIYKIRNQLVHQKDYEDKILLEITRSCWPILIDYIIAVSIELFGKFRVDAAYKFNLDDKEVAKIKTYQSISTSTEE